jgi:hypothetical protein
LPPRLLNECLGALAQRKCAIWPHTAILAQWRHGFINQTCKQNITTFDMMLEGTDGDVGALSDCPQGHAFDSLVPQYSLSGLKDFALRSFNALALRGSCARWRGSCSHESVSRFALLN